MKHTLLYILLFALILTHTRASAQDDDIVNATIHVSFTESGSKDVKYRPVIYARCKTEQSANILLAKLQGALTRQADYMQQDPEAWTKAVVQNRVFFKKSKGNGTISYSGFPDEALLISTYIADDDNYNLETDGQLKVVVLKAGKKDYDVTFTKDMASEHAIDNVNIVRVQNDSILIKPTIPIDDGKYLILPFTASIPKGYGDEEARLILQPMAVECQTEDTVDYIPGIVMEGRKYHQVQNRIMRFDYMKYDKVAYAYKPQPLSPDKAIVISDTIRYRKPNPKQNYKVPYTIEIADMNHIYFKREASAGSCNSVRLFKFLDLGVGAADMDIEEFYVDADGTIVTKNQDLRLKFEVGTCTLTTDSMNMLYLQRLTEELRYYGDRLNEVKIEATASPEGGYEKNLILAAQRTRFARTKVMTYLGNIDVRFREETPHVCTWEDVARGVEKQGYEDLADRIRQRMGPNGYGGDAEIMNLPEYTTVIMPMLENLRVMHITYKYAREHRMDEKEVTRTYYQRKAGILKGWGKDLSDGDYYNLFHIIKDSLEQDTITMMAYRHILKQPGYNQEKFAMYIANRMAMLNLKRGTPDINVLRPFINYHSHLVTEKEMVYKAQKNRREVLINQIITYFQLEDRDTAVSLVDFWFSKDTDPKVEKLKRYVVFKERFFPYILRRLSGQQKKDFEDAMQFVYSCAKDNKAVIYGEAYGLLGRTNAEADSIVSMMNDDNPKKWYLKGILAAHREEEHLLQLHPAGFVPDYLAYFHHSFLMEPSYKLLYFNEGQVTDELRKKFRYQKKDFPLYDLRFQNIAMLHHHKAVNTLSENDEMPVSGVEEEIIQTEQ